MVKGQPDEVGENIQDTYEDLSVYGVISQIVQRKKWKNKRYVFRKTLYLYIHRVEESHLTFNRKI